MRRSITSLAIAGTALMALHAAAVLQSESTAFAQENQPRQTVFIKIGRPG